MLQVLVLQLAMFKYRVICFLNFTLEYTTIKYKETTQTTWCRLKNDIEVDAKWGWRRLIHVAQDGDQWRTLADTEISFQVL